MLNEILFKKLNKEQKTFVNEDKGHNVLVSASAGTGKTTTMIRKLLYLIAVKGISINNLLVVTYTNAAASEMKQKLYENLLEALNAEEGLGKHSFLQEEIDNINNADIGTIHSICKKIIRKYFYEVGVDPVFSIITDKEQGFVFNQSVENVFNNYTLEEDSEFFELYENYSKNRDGENLKAIVKTIYIFLTSKIDKKEWINSSIENSYNLDLEKNICLNFLNEHYKDIFKNFLPIAKDLYNRAKVIDDKKIVACVAERIGFINAILESSSFMQICIHINNFSLKNKPTLEKNVLPEKIEMHEELGAFVSSLNNTRSDAKKIYSFASEEDIKEELRRLSTTLLKIFEIVGRVEGEYSKRKQAKGVLDFNDLEHYTLRILQNEKILEELKDNYEYIFIDEYQDVNEVQEGILSALSRGDNCYMIGDVKQSIYAFRQSTPKIFLEKFNKFKEINSPDKVINFNTNYRSENNILQFANSIFDVLITKDTVGIDYKNEARLTAGTSALEEKDAVDISFISNDDNSSAQEVQEMEARLIIEKIAELVSSKTYKKDGADVPYTYKDIVVLLRKKSGLSRVLYNKMQEFHIPASTVFSSDLFGQNEIKILMSVLRVINNVYDDISLCTLLKSPIVGLTEEDLAQIRIVQEEEFFYQCVVNYKEDDEIFKKISRILRYVDDIKFFMLNHNLKDTVNKVLKDFDLKNYFKSMPDGLEKESNIEEFIKIVSNENFAYSLPKFLDYATSIEKEEYTLKLNGEENCVRIMTMHGSKGLGFPAVIIGGLGQTLQFNFNSSDIVLNNNFGVGIKLLDNENRIEQESIIKQACLKKNLIEEVEESIRLLYVALTRPKNYLYIVGSYLPQNVFKYSSESIYDSKSYIQMFFKTLSKPELQFFANSIKSFAIREKTPAKCTVKIESSKDILELYSRQGESVILSGESREVVEKIKKSFAFVYPHNTNKNIATKNSVTSILKEVGDYENVVYAPKNFEIGEGKTEGLDSLKLGTTYHKILEKIDFLKQVEDKEIEDIISQLLLLGSIEKIYSQSIDKGLIKSAVENIQALLTPNCVLKKEAQFLLNIPHKDIVEGSSVEDKILVQGVIDLVIEGKDYVYIIDFKSNKYTNEEYLKNNYKLQLELYAKAFEYAYDKKVSKKYLYSILSKKLIEV